MGECRKADLLVSAVHRDELTFALELVEVKSASFNRESQLPRNDGFFFDEQCMATMRAESRRLEEASGTPCKPADRPDDQHRWLSCLVQSREVLESTESEAVDDQGEPLPFHPPIMLHTPIEGLRVVTVAPMLWVAALLQKQDDPFVARIPFHWVERCARPIRMPRSGDSGWVMRWANIPGIYWHDMRIPSLIKSLCGTAPWAKVRARQSADAQPVEHHQRWHLQSMFNEDISPPIVPLAALVGPAGDKAPSAAQLGEIGRLAKELRIDPPRVRNARQASKCIAALRRRGAS